VAPAPAAPSLIRALAREHRVDLEPALAAYERRLKLAAEEGVDLSAAQFSASFGRAFEYYTGFVFEILSASIGETTPIGGGGRYDTLVSAMSGERRVAAVGSAIHTERLLLAVRGGRP
jgi:ATP phosphoribosyltransferase regulatory subunit